MKNKALSILQNYRNNVFELSEIEQELREATVHDAVQSAAKFPYSKHTVPVDGVPPGKDAYHLQIQAQELRQEIRQAKQIVKTLPNARLRAAAKIYYLDEHDERVTWEDVADIIGGGVTGESLRNAIKRNLKK